MYEDGAYNNFSRESLSQMKRKLTLDLNSRPPKKQRPGGGVGAHFNPLLTSPDLNQLKLASPELERLIMQQGTTILANNPATPSQFNFFPRVQATEEQEEFAKGFVDTLEQLHHQGGSSSEGGGPSVVVTTVSGSGGPSTAAVVSEALQYTQLGVHPHHPSHHLSSHHDHGLGHVPDSHLGLLPPHQIKEEPQMVPSMAGSPPMSPIDMDVQEGIKLERKRLRNRIAASKQNPMMQ